MLPENATACSCSAYKHVAHVIKAAVPVCGTVS